MGAFLLTSPSEGSVVGYSAGVGWTYRSPNALAEVGGHVTSSLLLTTATPMTVRFTPLRDSRVRPYLGLGASLLVPHLMADPLRPVPPGLLVGLELSGGLGVELGGDLFLSTEARYQNFAAQGAPFSGERQELATAYLGLGLHL